MQSSKHYLARVIEVNKGFLIVSCENGKTFRVRLKSSLYNKKQYAICGDIVLFEKINSYEIDGLVISIEERKNSLVRPTIANIDNLFFVISFKDPLLSNFFIAKSMVLFNMNKISYTLLLTKPDLVAEQIIKTTVNMYRKEEIEVLIVEKGNVNLLKKNAKIILIMGRSGVGKTTIVNHVTNANLQVGGISKKHKKGKHTTTQLKGVLYKNTIIFDSPGIEKMIINNLTKEEIAKYFFNERIKKRFQCSYNTCNHLDEKNCKLPTLVKENKINQERFLIYKTLFTEAKVSRWLK